MDVRNFAVQDTLRNGMPVTIRAVRADDRDRIAQAFRHLDRESVYRRFFTFKEALSDAELARLTTPDFVREVGLVATLPAAELEIIVGAARYVAHAAGDGTRVAEVAFTIEEDYQGLGLAGRLLKHLADVARAAGVVRFEAEVLRENKGMLRVFARSGLPMRQKAEADVVHITLDLTANP